MDLIQEIESMSVEDIFTHFYNRAEFYSGVKPTVELSLVSDKDKLLYALYTVHRSKRANVTWTKFGSDSKTAKDFWEATSEDRDEGLRKRSWPWRGKALDQVPADLVIPTEIVGDHHACVKYIYRETGKVCHTSTIANSIKGDKVIPINQAVDQVKTVLKGCDIDTYLEVSKVINTKITSYVSSKQKHDQFDPGSVTYIFEFLTTLAGRTRTDYYTNVSFVNKLCILGFEFVYFNLATRGEGEEVTAYEVMTGVADVFTPEEGTHWLTLGFPGVPAEWKKYLAFSSAGIRKGHIVPMHNGTYRGIVRQNWRQKLNDYHNRHPEHGNIVKLFLEREWHPRHVMYKEQSLQLNINLQCAEMLEETGIAVNPIFIRKLIKEGLIQLPEPNKALESKFEFEV